MRSKLRLTILCCFLLAISACKKDSETPVSSNMESTNRANVDLLATALVKPLTVVTIAGKPNVEGYKDGVGQEALFKSAVGIELTNDGNLFVADTRNNRIRKVTQNGVVSTLGFPSGRDGSKLLDPYFVKQAADGTIAVFAYQFEYDLKYKFWIWKPGVVTFNVKASKNANYGGWSADPYDDFYWTSGLEYTASGFRGFIEKFLPNGTQAVDTYYLPLDRLTPEDQKFPVVSKIFSAYNGVKYLVVNNTHVYKYTPSGELTRIFNTFYYGIIDDIIANKDSRTVYLTSGGRIYSISNNIVHYLVGPQAPDDGHDGVGEGADVHAFNLALSKDENTLYFTDTHRTIRKLLLK
jgi:hypothetical protein